jgi:hypothetical protein
LGNPKRKSMNFKKCPEIRNPLKSFATDQEIIIVENMKEISLDPVTEIEAFRAYTSKRN